MGKFNSMCDEYVYGLSLEGVDPTTGDVSTIGWHATLVDLYGIDLLTFGRQYYAAALVVEDDQGFVKIHYYASYTDAREMFEALDEEYILFNGGTVSQSRRRMPAVGSWYADSLMDPRYNGFHAEMPGGARTDLLAAQSNSLTVGLLYFGRWDGERYQRRMAAQYAAVMAGAWRSVLMEDMYAFHVFGHHASA